jgi:hypothetical protein
MAWMEGTSESSLFGLLIIAEIVPELVDGREYLEARSPIGDGGFGKAKDSEGENASSDFGVRSWRLLRILTKRY